ncbi:MAG: DUF5686 family protein [Flavobacteriaceae bacterium]|jgi:hypothetical protein|nr:DUF5686 family protein [Flavobacteriaceae bacterium]
MFLKKTIFLLSCLLCALNVFAQIEQLKGTVLSSQGEPISNCFVFIKNTTHHTTTDENGHFSIPVEKRQMISFQKEGFEIKRHFVYSHTNFEHLQIKLTSLDDANLLYDEPQDQYAAFLIAQISLLNPTITQNTKVDYYSKGKLELTTAREKFLGQKRKDLVPSLDLDTLSNYIYLSELKSQLYFRNSQGVKEKIIAVQERGTNKNVLFQTGMNSDFNFYNKSASTQVNVISPIYEHASTYYYYKLESIEKDEDGFYNYCISFTPKRSREPIADGQLTINSRNYQLVSIEARMFGTNVNLKNIKELTVVQDFTYNKKLNRYTKDKQTIDLDGRFLVFDFSGIFSSFYSNYEDMPDGKKYEKANELITYSPNFDKQSESFYNLHRPIPLSKNEQSFFDTKTLFVTENTKATLDSIDKRTNNFTLFKLIKGYEYINSYKNTRYTYHGLISTFAFNAVQGFNVTTGIDYAKIYENEQQTKMGMVVTYGTNESKFRFSGYASHIFNEIDYNTLTFSGGTTILQFNQDDPIKTPINSFASAWFGKNYAKYFEKKYFKIQYSQYAFNGIKLNFDVEYALRETLKNYVITPPFVPTMEFESNNPLDPTNHESKPFINNGLFKINLSFDFVFDQKIINYPNKKQYIPTSKFPILSFTFEKGLSTTTSDYNYTFAQLSTKYSNNIGNLGNLFVGLSIGKFFEENNIAFTDYKHFNGNQTFVGSTPIYNKHFNLLPYYEYSTNKHFVEFHAEHDFRGFIMNKIPLLNKTRYSIITGFHVLSIPEKQTYREFSIGLNNFGFGKIRPFRIDYFTTLSSNTPKKHGVILGIKVLDLIQK